MNNHFSKVAPARVPRSVFNLSYEKKLTCDMGELIPVMHDEVVPGDVFKIGADLVIRMQPIVAPVLHEINAYIHYFFVPYRLLWDDWEKFITGDVDGDDATAIITWEPTNTAASSLWDYCGFPVGVDPDGFYPTDFIRRAYARIYNDYYRDENIITEVLETNESILNRSWEKDYFTSCLPWQQRGTAPALPVTGTTSAVWPASFNATWPAVNAANQTSIQYNSATNAPYAAGSKSALEANTIAKADLDNNTVDLSSATTFDVSDLRLAIQIQRWMERNARAGVRYTEFLNAHFGVSPRDDRLQRPEYIGGLKTPVIVSEVLQTSETGTTPQGNMSGHGISADSQFICKYHAQEYGMIMGILSIMPRPLYQQGINRQFIKSTRYDFYFPEFANLSEQVVYRGELYATGVLAENQTLFGYQGRYDEHRVKQSQVVAGMRSTFDYWHISRQFGAAPELNSSFLNCIPRKDIFADVDEDGFIVSVGNVITGIRPMPAVADPGYMDH